MLISISVADIPEYLQKSEHALYFERLNQERLQRINENREANLEPNEEDLETNQNFDVPDDKFKLNETVLNIKDWVDLLNTCTYWGLSPEGTEHYYPISLYSYYVDHPIDINFIAKYAYGPNNPAFLLIKNSVIDIMKERYLVDWRNFQFSFVRMMKDRFTFPVLTYNHNITFDLIDKNLDLPWNIYFLSRKKEITFDYILHHPEVDWNPEGLIANPNITFPNIVYFLQNVKSFHGLQLDKLTKNEDLNKNFHFYLQRYSKFFQKYHTIFEKYFLMDTQPITWDLVLRNPNVGWSLNDLLNSPYIDLDSIIEYTLQNLNNPNINPFLEQIENLEYPQITLKTMLKYNHIDDIDFKFFLVYDDPDFTLDFIKNNPELEVENVVGFFHFYPRATPQDLIDYPTLQWNYEYISEDDKITIDFVNKHRNLPWDYTVLTHNPNITFEIIQQNPDIPWDFLELSENPNITAQFIFDHPEINWGNFNDSVQYSIMKKKDFDYSMVIHHPEINWDYHELGSSLSITWEDVYNSQDKTWDYPNLIYNSMNYAEEKYIKKRLIMDGFIEN